MNEPLCMLDDIPDGQSRSFTHQDMSLVAVRKANEVYVYHNSCPHLGLPLEWQADKFLNIDKTLIQCNTHGALFTIEEGLCVSGPCHGASLVSVPCKVENGAVLMMK